MSDLRITIEDCDDNDAADLIRHLAEMGLMAKYERSTPRSRTGWAPWVPEFEEDDAYEDAPPEENFWDDRTTPASTGDQS